MSLDQADISKDPGEVKKTIWMYLRNYRFKSILIRYFIIIFLLVVFPNGALSILYNYNTNKVLMQEITSENHNSLSRNSGMIENMITELNGFAYNLSVSQDCLSFVYDIYEDTQSFELTQRLNHSIQFLIKTYDYIDSIYIYSEKQELVIDGRKIMHADELTDKTWLTTYKEMGENNFIVKSRRKNDNYPYFITLICPVHAGITQTVGAVVININIEGIAKVIADSKDSKQLMLIVDDDMHLYYSSDIAIMNDAQTKADIISLLRGQDADFSGEVEVDGKNMLVSSIDSDKYSWRYYLLSPLSLFEQKLDDMNKFMLTVTIIISSLSLLISYYLTVKSFEPVRRIIGIVENPPLFFKDNTETDKKNDEIQYITNLVHKNQLTNSRLTMELDERMEMLTKAQLRALQSQIDPHFLYNTLDTINWMAYEELGDGNNVSKMVITLAQLLRMNLKHTSYLLTVREEVEQAKLYVKILEARYKDKLRVEWLIDDLILECSIVKLSIQPLVENAIQHGLRSRRYKGRIVIMGCCVDSDVSISVEDDGVGMSEEAILNLNEHLANNYELDDAHIGIRNVNQRIKLLFGEKYGVHIAANKSGGLIVTLIIPWEQKNG